MRIGVGGCVASQEGAAIIERAPYVDVVFGPQTLHRLPELLNRRVASGGGSLHDNGDGTWTYTPARNYSGPVSFSYDVNDGITSVANTASVAVTPVNDAPTIVAAPLLVFEGGTMVLNALNFIVYDPDSSSFTFTVSNVTHGRFQVKTGSTWGDASSFTTADINAGHVRFVHDGSEGAPTFSVQADDGASANNLSNTANGPVIYIPVNDAPVITSASFAVSEGGTVVLHRSDFGVSDPDSSNFKFTVSGVTHGHFQTYSHGHWSNDTTFTTAELDQGRVRFVHDGGETAPTFSIKADDGAFLNHAGGTVAGTVQFTNVNDAPVITAASLAISNGGTVIIHPLDIGISDPDSSSFTFYAGSTHGSFEILDGGNWISISSTYPVTSADIAAGYLRFHHDGSGIAPVITVTVSDGSASSAPFPANVDFTANAPNTVFHLTSTAGTSIDVSGYGATNGFVLPGAGNVTTPGTPEDRIILGYHIGDSENPVVVNGSPLMGDNGFTPLSHNEIHNEDGSNSVWVSVTPWRASRL
eukprot:gene27260-35817_t